MSANPTDGLAHRRVVTGVDASGRSVVVSDAASPVTMRSAAFSLVETWRFAGAPDSIGPDESVVGDAALDPVGGQVLMRFCHFPPEKPDTDWQGALESIGGGDALQAGARPGVHQTDTIDHITVISGEIYCALDDGEVLLRAGDTIIQRGTAHAWSNRSDTDCVVLTIQIGLRRQA